jgi:NAD-dependent dihydropyrimidine dehydrogenase PreA subunit
MYIENSSPCVNAAPVFTDRYTYIYHSTFEANMATGAGARGAGIDNESTLYLYNNILTGNKINGVVTTAGQIYTAPTGNTIYGENLIHNGTTITSQTLFDNCFFIPLPFAKSATRLTAGTISTPSWYSAAAVISRLATDLKGTLRPTSGNVTHGALESGATPPTEYSVNVSPSPASGGTATSIVYGNYNNDCDCGVEAIITAEEKDCYKFLHWTNSTGTIMPYKQTDTIKLTSNLTLIAVFEGSNYNINLEKNIAEAGEVSQEDGDDCNKIITATPNDCYKFLHWQNNAGTIMPFKQTDTIKPIAPDSTLIAVFEEND